MATTIGSNVLDAVNQTSSTSSAAKTKASDDLRTNFMTLLTTQLQNQDPTKPMENSELTSQLAQINTVSGIESLNTTMSAITGQISTSQQMQASALIGHGVLVDGNRILVGDGETTPFGIELAGAADSVKVTIKNSAGEVVHSADMGAMSAGVQSYSWDGKLEDGSVAPDGAYTFSIEASANGVSQKATALNYALVNGVGKNTDGDIVLDLGGTYGQVKYDTVRQVI
ncbi:flagellar hook assembly protein FlgD [Pseudomonas putida]|uniref:Basal-body rod modification protein FlgD n=1 Tax=Pseudomonas putida TaxID=303 RepID=A0A8I1EA11_PSEPU|nr:flagellar hook assembly protein FlgD [Pseudomonas putida]MBI6882569.1 flagellar hook assembly protein FlgD [Pseudomonas putida]